MFNLKIGIFTLLLITINSLTVSDFKPKFFTASKPSGFYNVETGTPNSGEVLTFVDLNGDK